MGVNKLWTALSGAEEHQSLLSAALSSRDRQTKRIAIDVAIWSFQCEAAQGGDNASLRTFYARLCRLANAGVRAVFVFDGPDKPSYKRGKRTHASRIDHTALKTLVELFGYMVWQAPGEAEAECAYLQMSGYVDAVLSDDVDALIFGATRVYRCWAAVLGPGSLSSKSLNHTLCYTREAVEEKCGLTRSGLILVALLAGGDYHPAGVPRCGIKTAVEIAKAGFGDSLLQNLDEIDEWKRTLAYALKINSENRFRQKHKALRIPDSFPNLEILKYYTHPVVSQPRLADRGFRRFGWHQKIDLSGIRSFLEEHLDLQGRFCDVKIVRTLAQPLLTHECLRRAKMTMAEISGSNKVIDCSASKIVILGHRQHKSCDFRSELRIGYVPFELVPVQHSLAELEDSLCAKNAPACKRSVSPQPQNYTKLSQTVADEADDEFNDDARGIDLTIPARMWIPRIFLEWGFPDLVEAWTVAQNSKLAKSAKSKIKPARNRALDGFVEIGKKIDAKTFTRSSSILTVQHPRPSPRVEVHHSEIIAQQVEQIDQQNGTAKSREDRVIIASGQSNVVLANLRTTTNQHFIVISDDDNDTESKADESSILQRQLQARRIRVRASLPGTWCDAGIDEIFSEDVSIVDLTHPV